ncbi:MAG: hypothetical protein KF819_23630 [Labilithrix sp.]|nr:hypothetical protein [Labilithrix sp.]
MTARSVAAAAAVVACSLAASRDASAQCRGRPTDAAGYQGYSYGAAEVRSYATAAIRVHYATTGAYAPNLATTRGDGVPDVVALAGDSGQQALAKYAEMGFKSPPSDAACASNGGDDKLDIYLVAFAGADGSAVPEACSGRVCSTFMLVDSSFLGRGYPSIEEGFRTVVSHELFHAVQNAYDQDIERFWAEGTAQWAMKSVFPELVDFERQLPAFFKDNTRSLDTQPSGVTAGYLYGSAVWPLFLTLRHGPDTVQKIFEAEADGTKALAATEAVLAAKGSSLAETYPLFGAWNAATKSLAGSGGYPDAAKYPGVKIEALADGVSAITSGLGYFVYQGVLDAPSKISLETDATRNAGVVVPLQGGKADLAQAKALPADFEGDVLVVVAGITTKKTDAPFTVRIGAPDAGSSSSGGASGEEGGCSTSPSSARDPLAALPLAALAVAFVLSRARRR